MTSAADNLGAHLLGRVPSVPDERNWPLSAFLAGTPTKLDVLLAALVASHAAKATKAWAQEVTRILDGAPTPIPTPTPNPPAPAAVRWPDAEQLDQGNSSHCVGYGWAQFGNTLPVDDHFTDADGDSIYYAAKVIDGEPNQENGSSVHSGAKAMKQRGRLNGYAWAANLDELKAWVLGHGPVTVGTDWTDGMFTPDGNGFVHPTGQVAGGHCFVCVGYDPDQDVLTFQNSWGSSWGDNGFFYMHGQDFEPLLAGNGEAATAVELT